MKTSIFKLPIPLFPSNTHLLLFVSLLLFPLPFSNQLLFRIPQFDPDATNILYEGDASPYVGSIKFNNVDYLYQVGRAIYTESVHLWDSASGKLSDFTTYFSFMIDTRGESKYGHGIAFFLAPVGFQIPPNSGGGFLGLFNTSTRNSPQNQIVLVEFDSFVNEEWDPKYEHVGINNNSISSAIAMPWNASLHSGDFADVWITYNATTKNLSVSWAYKSEPAFQANSTLSYCIDLTLILPEWVTIGFSASTGMNVEYHILNSWEFSSSLDINHKNENTARKTFLTLGVVISVLLFIIVVSFIYVVFWKHKRALRWYVKTFNQISINDDLERGAGPKRFSYCNLASATNNFSDERKLGQGGFGGVYEGFLSDLNVEVAVKRISSWSRQGQKEYVTEVKIISQLRHRNLVQLIGWCHDRGEFLLVYEFMPNGSLDSHLFGKKRPLAWAVRHKVTLGLASALLYLHEEWEQCVVHRDIKCSNIMLDSSFNVKLGDFGLARLMDHELGPQTTGLAGTLGYMAPEYISTGRASKESDVYSFGVVVLEIVTGKRSSDTMEITPDMGLVEWVWDLYGRRDLHSAADRRLCSDFDAKQVECLLVVGLWCSHPDRTLRPSIRQASQVLNFDAAMPTLPVKMPVPIYHVPGPSLSSDISSESYNSLELGR